MKKLLLITAMFIAFGAQAQLRLVFNISGTSDSYATPFFADNNRLFFKTLSPIGRIYSTDGYTSYLNLYDSNLSQGSYITEPQVSYVYFNNELHFSTRLGSLSRIAKTTPTQGECIAYANLGPLTGFDNSIISEATSFGNQFLFTPTPVNPTNAIGAELYGSDGNSIYVIKNINSSPQTSSTPRGFKVLGTNCFFSADDGTNGRELWKTDGTLAGTTLYLDMIVGGVGSNPADLNVIGTQLTFVATHPTLGRELFRTNGSGSLTLIKDINTSGDSNPTNVTAISDKLYFSASNGANNQEPYFSSGVNLLSTSNIKDINASGSSNPAKFTQLPSIPSLVIFTANDGLHGVELWITDGTPANTYMLKDINPTGDSNPDEFKAYNGKLYFTADNGVNGKQLWVTDGSGGASGTFMISINPTGTSNISNLIVYNNELYFSADAGVGIGKELYAYKDPALSTSNFNVNENTITLSPNPSKDYFNLTTALNVEKVEVYSTLGQLVKTFDKQDQYKISDLAKGAYIVKVNTVEGTASKTLLVE